MFYSQPVLTNSKTAEVIPVGSYFEKSFQSNSACS